MSLRKLTARIRRALRGKPRGARDLIPDYAEYLRLQRETYASHESEVERWARGQRRFVEEAFAPLSRTLRVLDCACGDGVGLEALGSMGFKDPVGVEIAPQKAARARALGFRVEEADMHDLSAFADGSFDAILSSHTLEHAYDPGRALEELRRLLVPGGRLFVVLPFPDTGERNELAHVGKHELGTDRDDGGEAASLFFATRGFNVVSRRLDDLREPEIWLFLCRHR